MGKFFKRDVEQKKQEENKSKKQKNAKRMLLIGYILMMIGISLPLVPLVNSSISSLKNKIEYEKFAKSKHSYSESKIMDYNDNVIKNKDTGIIDPFKNDDYKVEYDIMKNNADDVFAFIQIPKIKVNLPIRLGASYDNLNRGAAQIDNTSLPVGGIGNRSVIAGHRGWYDGNMFLHINRLKKGDEVIIVDNSHKKLVYRVIKKYIIKPNDWEALKPIEGEDILTLLTCDPVITTNPNRLVIDCVRYDEYGYGNYSKKSNSSISGIKDTSSKNLYKEDFIVKILDKLVLMITLLGLIAEIVLLYKVILVLKSK